ncbi:ABC-type nitrate/sulfonate/bicarbonate transport system, periplasmic component [Desulfitobacterium dichloroeliminans LMG P-21439]|uniref:ABC-type nitrate/sulfonate/bicarbonate transport system, periplasmic component n=1 Tax=Desulfitobacterium dichloroeliminans (strain LMG P-21439 / DCA1) TaxID=871963 RepID=L0FBU5_DESDL|nr:ABC transporter substrate-binding protein [Desulfitobacterium dichloroeliminans]AGA70687.1 ABC-type nitrate/sulfonate/bicarbonate transport system, periplasmic component [Desulfitobacterium dichloroeliminans LMG P-21439]
MKRRIGLLMVIALTVALILTGCGDNSSKENQLTKIRVSEVTHSIFYAPQYVALTQGFFKEEGLDIELTNGGGADKVMTAVLTGQVEIGFAGPEASIYVYNEGKEDNAIVFAQLTNGDGTFLIGREQDPDFQWSDLQGKTIIGGRKGGMPEVILQYVLRNNGLTPGKDVFIDTTMQFNAMPGAFLGGQGDYVILFEPTGSAMEKEGKAYIVASLGKESGEVPYTAYFAKKSYIEKNPNIIQKFTNAVYKGQRWVESHSPEEIAQAIKPHFPDADAEILTTVVKRYKEQNSWKKDPVLLEKDLQVLQQALQDSGELSKTAPYAKIITPVFGETALKSVK